MLNRRHLRIKVLQVMYAFFQTEDEDILKSEKQLLQSIERMYELYLWFLLTFEEVQRFSAQRIEDRMKKVRPTADDLAPNRKFADNAIFEHFKNNVGLRRAAEENSVNWLGAVENDLMKKLFLHIVDSDVYNEYMGNEERSFEQTNNLRLTYLRRKLQTLN